MNAVFIYLFLMVESEVKKENHMAAKLNNNEDYKNCVVHCAATFGTNKEALVACINGCATVNAPPKVGEFATEVGQLKAKVQAEVQKLGKVLNEEIESLEA